MNTEILEKLSELNASQREMLANQANQQKLLEKHSELLERQGETLLRNTITVEDHKRRSDLLEAEQKIVREEIASINAHVNRVKGVITAGQWAGGIIGTLATLGSIIWGAFQLFKMLGL